MGRRLPVVFCQNKILILTTWNRMMDYFYDGWMYFFGLQNLSFYSLPL